MRTMVKIFAALILITTTTLAYAEETLDKVAIIVNDGVVLESEVQQLLQEVKFNAAARNTQLPEDKVLRIQAMDRLILQQLQLQIASRMGITVSDTQLQQAIQSIAQEEGRSTDEMRKAIMASGVSWENYRESLRKEIITSEVQRAAVQRRVFVSPQEINNLVNILAEASEGEVEYRLGHILVGMSDSANADEVQATRTRAEKLLALLRDGADFEQAAISSSSGSRALEGGDLGWMNVNAMPTLFADVIRGKEKGELIGPLRSGVGFHILKISDVRGIQKVEIDEVKVRHILVQPSIILSERRAEELLNEYREQIIAGEASFADLAREHSADPGSAASGGDLGWSEPSAYAEEFAFRARTLPVGDISAPFKTQFGWHIMEVVDRRTQDATKRSQENRAYQLLFSRKYQEELENWQQEIRDQAYIETLINES